MTLARQQTSQSEADPTLPVSRMPSPSSSCHDEKSVNGLPTYAAPSIFPHDYNVPSGIDHTSQFFEILTAPYRPPASLSPWRRITPRQEDVERCAAMVDWGDTDEDSTPPEGSSTLQRESSLHENSAKDIPIYVPHGPCAWAAREDIQQTETLLSLRQGSMCSAYVQSGVIAGQKITFISRRWNLDKQADWIGFNSEMTLYSSEQYLKPLQGVIVPRIIGVHILPGAISIAMELPHQSFWIEASPTMPDVLKERAMQGLEMLHSRGILHGDIELRHVLIGGDGAVTFIDFQLSRSTNPDESVGLEKAEDEEFRFEKRLLAFKLDLHGARASEIQKTEAFVQRTKRNKRRDELWKRRAQGARTGYIPPYEEEPEEEKIVPPVHPHDLQDTWIKNSDSPPVRVVVPGQSKKEVETAIRTFLESLAESRPDQALSRPLLSIGSSAEVSEAGPSTSSITSVRAIDFSPTAVHESSPSLAGRKRYRESCPSPSPHASLASSDSPPSKRVRRETESSSSASVSSTVHSLPAIPFVNPRDHVHMWYSDLPDDAEVPPPPVRVRPLSLSAALIRQQNIEVCREAGLPHAELVERGEVSPINAVRHHLLAKKRRGIARGNLLRERDRDGYSPYVHHIERSHQRERYLALKELKNGYIATCANVPNLSDIPMQAGDRTFSALLHMNEHKDIPEGPRILQRGEYELIQDTRRQAMILTPHRGVLKRRREDDLVQNFLPAMNSPNPAVPVADTGSTIPPPRKKARTKGPSRKLAPALIPLFRTSDPGSFESNKTAKVNPLHDRSLARRRSRSHPASGIDFTPPSWRGLSVWMGSLMGWSQ
ncbi:uncharacterized protein BJ212DRAFT_1475490 [Suillus subaureus]|uniref:Protein kinase domain-containing protein n=1 Tax=Suillus subaureus TaxID=48587 RepID=A0A9P7JJV5_9AGAM|nr:uncharacterized protein BJ212DRAFT_1475490 [Suillus subaureus]KAG1826153.1 hypothetical protein BJ212DRAFT_1475490 [Suillus subaureus]